MSTSPRAARCVLFLFVGAAGIGVRAWGAAQAATTVLESSALRVEVTTSPYSYAVIEKATGQVLLRQAQTTFAVGAERVASAAAIGKKSGTTLEATLTFPALSAPGRQHIGRPVEAAAQQRASAPLNWSKVRVLVYTKNGKGYVHDNIPNSIEAIKALGREHRFPVDATDDPAAFTDDNLKRYRALVFSNTNNTVFDTDAQRVALMRYVQAGGGVAAIHSASGTERTWSWFAAMLGGRFLRHPPIQKFRVRILEPMHPSLAHLPETWERDDECYYLVHMSVNLRVLAVNDLTTVNDPQDKPATFGDVFPSVWSQEFDGGRQWYTSWGHRKEDYATPEFRRHILGGIQAVVRNAPLDYKRAYATSPTEPVRRPHGLK